MLTGVLIATVRDPSGPGPGARLHSGLKGQGDVGVADNPAHFRACTGVPPGHTNYTDSRTLSLTDSSPI
jgi:hypothetical protein